MRSRGRRVRAERMAGAGSRLGKEKKEKAGGGKGKARGAAALRPVDAKPPPPLPEGKAEASPPQAEALRRPGSPEEEAARRRPLKAIGSRAQLERSLREAGEQLVVVFFSGSWCETCWGLEPAMSELAQLHRSVAFYQVNVDDSEDTAEACDIVHLPTFQFYKLGKRVAEVLDDSRESVERKIKELK